jgi:hypothetical protein
MASTNAPETCGMNAWLDARSTDPEECVLNTPPDGYENATWHGYLGGVHEAGWGSPETETARVSGEGNPLAEGYCHPSACGGGGSNSHDLVVGPEGQPWASFVGFDPNASDGEELVTRLADGASLWDETDPNGPYPDPSDP